MSRWKVVKTVLFAAVICVGLWQAARFVEVLSQARSQPGTEHALRSMLSGSQVPAFGAGALQAGGSFPFAGHAKSDEIVVFASNGRRLTPEEQEALRREAERHRPRAKQGGDRPAPPIVPPRAGRNERDEQP